MVYLFFYINDKNLLGLSALELHTNEANHLRLSGKIVFFMLVP
jgi:hypothetical protein